MNHSNWKQGKEQSDYHFDWLRHETTGHDYKWLARFEGDWAKELEEIKIKEGQCIFFHPHLYHSVNPNQSNGRCVISGNILYKL